MEASCWFRRRTMCERFVDELQMCNLIKAYIIYVYLTLNHLG